MIKLASMEILSAEIAGSRHIRRQAAKALGVKSSFINKTAHRATFEYDPRPGYLYVRSRAISSRCNDNYDEFPASEIKEAYHTFVGKPVFVNHVNEDHRRARGVIIDAALHEDHNHDGTPDTWAEVLMEVDANSFPKLAQAILAGHVDRTSMGCDVKYSVCSACGNKASTPSEYCSHIPRQKGSKLVRRSAATGRPEEVLIREICYGLGFFENSLLVEDPADPTAYAGSGLGDIGINWSGKESGNPFPNLPLSDASNNRRSYAKLMGNISEGQLTPTSTPLTDSTLRQEESDSSHLGLSQFVSSISDTSGLSESLDHIGRVISAGPKDPMSGVVTDGVVTGMTYHDTIRNRADEIDVPPTMGSDGLSRFIREAKASIPTIEDTASPRVTGVRSSTGIDLGEVSLNLSHGRNELSITAGHDNESTVQREASVRPSEGLGAFVASVAPSEDQFGSYSLQYKRPDKTPRHRIIANDEDGNRAGDLYWHPKTHKVTNVTVYDKHQRQGLATAMWNKAKTHDPLIRHADEDDRSDDGKAWSAKTASITMTPPEIYRKFEYPDYKAKTLPTLARDLKKASPHYYNTLKDDIAQNGVKEPILVRHTMGGRPLKRPEVMSGHHRAAIAHELNLHIPVGDYDNDEDHRASMDIGQSWFRDHAEDKAEEPSPWKREGGLESFVASVNTPPNPGGQGHVFEPEEPGSPWCAECGHHNSVTRHKEAGLEGFVAAQSICTECGYNLPHHDSRCRNTPRTESYCSDHRPVNAQVIGSDDGKLTCSVCGVNGYHVKASPVTKTSAVNEEHLTNPADGTKDWHHGTQNDFKHFDEERPEDEDPDNEAEYDPDNNPHWNSHIGTHWTSLHDTAHKFARGIAYGWNHQPKDTGEGHIFTANLGINKPKRYKSETDMDHEAFNHAWEHHDTHDPDDIHGSHCDNNECYGLEEHDPGDHVDRAAKSHYGEKGQDARWLSGHPDSQSIAEGFKQRLQKKGHDGITYGNAVPEEGPVGHKCAITFDNHQIHNLVRRNRQGHVAGLAAFVAVNSDDDDLTRKSPLEIDSRLAEHHDKLDHHHTRMNRIVDTLHSVVHDKKEYRGKRSFWKKSDDEVMNHDPSTLSSWDRPQYEKLKNQHEEHHAAAQEQRSHIDRHEDEFHRRGKWNRFFIVPDGHIHSSPQCHSLHPTTRIGWLPHLSGKTEKEAVDEHGPHLCTHCFKSAPTEWKLNPTDTKAQQKKDSGEVCTGGKMHRFVGREEGKERAAQHPKNKLVLEPGEGWHDGRGNVVGKCPTCKTTQKVKNNGSVYSHKPPKVEEPKPEEKPKQEEKPVLPEPASTPAPKAPEPAPKAPEPSTPTPTPKPTPAIPEKPLQPAPKSMNSHLTRDHKMDPQVIKTVKDTGASLDSFHDSLHQNLTTIKHRHGGLAAFAQQYTFHVDFSKDKDTLKTGEVVSGTHVVSVDAHHPEEGRLIAEQMVAATGHEPTGLTAFVSSLDKVYT